MEAMMFDQESCRVSSIDRKVSWWCEMLLLVEPHLNGLTFPDLFSRSTRRLPHLHLWNNVAESDQALGIGRFLQ